MKPAQEEIDIEIEKLEELLPDVRQYSIFGDNHHAAVEAQIKVLSEDMTEGEIYDEWEDPDNPDVNRNTLDSALQARRWLDGEAEESLSDDLEPLVTKDEEEKD